mgnify:CR=1 FL=1
MFSTWQTVHLDTAGLVLLYRRKNWFRSDSIRVILLDGYSKKPCVHEKKKFDKKFVCYQGVSHKPSYIETMGSRYMY